MIVCKIKKGIVQAVHRARSHTSRNPTSTPHVPVVHLILELHQLSKVVGGGPPGIELRFVIVISGPLSRCPLN